MIITRELINKNIKFHDMNNHVYDYNYLDQKIDAYKNLFITKGAKKGQKVVIGTQSSTSQIALVFACCELGLTIVIVGSPLPGGKTLQNSNLISPKFSLLLPIDYFILNNKHETNYFNIFQKSCRFTIEIDNEVLDYTPNREVWADEDTLLLVSTSSGTTNTPKVVKHTHGFLSLLILRNSKSFYGKMGMMSNLAHGSSPAVYFLPGLISAQVTDYVNLCNTELEQIHKILKSKNIQLHHLLVPYTILIDNFLSTDLKLETCVIHTLGLIRSTWVDKVKQGQCKDIVSIFGTNETSGPFLTNHALSYDFQENLYKQVDDFYKLSLEDNNLIVSMPVYNTKIKTFDIFWKQGEQFLHQGRNNLYRINDLEFNLVEYQNQVNNLLKAELIIDSMKNRIYLAIWDDTGLDTIDELNKWVKKKSNGLHQIDDYKYLKYEDFLTGVKLDIELLRHYFRNS